MTEFRFILSFFNENSANTVQFISLPLELVGFFLTFIELIRPEWANSLESFIDKSPKNIADFIFHKLYFLWLPIAILIFIIWFFGFFILFFISDYTNYNWVWMTIVIVLTIGFVLYFVPRLLKLIIKGLNLISNGKAIGSLGLFLAGLGVVGEIYQVITILFGN